jgi:hypothetical protein
MREWASTNWNATRLPSPIFEEECTSVLEISVSILLLLAETPPDVADGAEGRGGEGGSASGDGRQLIAALSGNSASKIISPLAHATVNVTPRAQRLSERLLVRINPGVRHQSIQSTGGLAVYSAGIHGKQAQPHTQRQAQVAEERMDGFLQWMYVNSESKRQSLTRSLIPSLSLPLSTPSPPNADPITLTSTAIPRPAPASTDQRGLMYIHRESRHAGGGGGGGGAKTSMPLYDPLCDTGEIETGRRDEIGRLYAAVTDADGREAAAREEVLRGKDEITDLWGRLVSEKERSLSLAHVLTKIASKLGVAIEFDLTLEGGYLEMIGIFENVLPNLIPLADMKLHHKAVAAMEARKTERVDHIRKVIWKWLHTKLAGAFVTFRNIIKERKHNRLLISKAIGIQKAPLLHRAFDTWLQQAQVLYIYI